MESLDAGADRIVVLNATNGIGSAGSRTRIATLLVDASLIWSALGVGLALRAATADALGVAIEARSTDTDRVVTKSDFAVGVGATR